MHVQGVLVLFSVVLPAGPRGNPARPICYMLYKENCKLSGGGGGGVGRGGYVYHRTWPQGDSTPICISWFGGEMSTHGQLDQHCLVRVQHQMSTPVTAAHCLLYNVLHGSRKKSSGLSLGEIISLDMHVHGSPGKPTCVPSIVYSEGANPWGETPVDRYGYWGC